MGFAKLHFEPGRIRNNSVRLCINAYLRAELDPNLVQPNVAGAGIPSNGKDDRVELVRVARSVVVLSGHLDERNFKTEKPLRYSINKYLKFIEHLFLVFAVLQSRNYFFFRLRLQLRPHPAT